MNNLAHISKDGKRKQTLKEHNTNVARYTAKCLKTIGLSDLGTLVGLLHDGKGTDNFQTYLKRSTEYSRYDQGYVPKPAFSRPRRGSVNHTFAGVIYVIERYHKGNDPFDDLTAEIAAVAIGAHHGLFDCENLEKSKNGFTHRLTTDKDVIQYDQAKESFEHEISSAGRLDSLFSKAREEVKTLTSDKIKEYVVSNSDKKQQVNAPQQMQMYIYFITKLVMSALIYADRRDTAEFYDGRDYSDIDGQWDRDIKEFERKYDALGHSDTGINNVRRIISDQCADFASHPANIYRMDIPTGGGKTLSSLRYALHHAEKFSKKKIIYVIPLLTIIEQNAKVIKQYLPSEDVLEHHSDVVKEDMSEEEINEYDLRRDRWASPVIITTLVEMLNILFGGKTSDIARMRALSDSIIIFDEVQSVPKSTLAMFNSALNFLSGFCGTTIILCSATQPEFDSLKDFPMNLSKDRMVDLTDEQMKYFKRHDYINLTASPMDISSLSGFAIKTVKEQNPLMIVCNTKSEARSIYKNIQKEKGVTALFLSAGLCKAHRKEVLDTVFKKLKVIQTKTSDEKLVLVTTQLVEAGVDVSFRSVIRILAGNDNLVQAAGRCDRSGEYGAGSVYLVKLSGENAVLGCLPDIIESQQSLLSTMCYKDFKPEDSEFIADFYKRMFTCADTIKKTHYPFHYKTKDLLMNDIMSHRMFSNRNERSPYFITYPFKTCGENFKVFNEDTYTILVPYKEGKDIIKEIEADSDKNIPAGLINKSSAYSVNIYDQQMKKLKEQGMIKEVCGGLIYVLDEQAYSQTGVEV